jgi:hypothetical protein
MKEQFPQESRDEQDSLSGAHAKTRAERLAMTPDDRIDELTALRAMQRHFEETGELTDA